MCVCVSHYAFYLQSMDFLLLCLSTHHLLLPFSDLHTVLSIKRMFTCNNRAGRSLVSQGHFSRISCLFMDMLASVGIDKKINGKNFSAMMHTKEVISFILHYTTIIAFSYTNTQFTLKSNTLQLHRAEFQIIL